MNFARKEKLYYEFFRWRKRWYCGFLGVKEDPLNAGKWWKNLSLVFTKPPWYFKKQDRRSFSKHGIPCLLITEKFLLRMQEIRSSNPPVVTGICDPNKSWARHHRNSCFELSGDRNTVSFELKSRWKDYIYWLLKRSCFKIVGDEKYGLFWAKKLMKRWYLLITEKSLF